MIAVLREKLRQIAITMEYAGTLQGPRDDHNGILSDTGASLEHMLIGGKARYNGTFQNRGRRHDESGDS